MKLLESYSLNSGAKIGQPFLLESFFPLPYSQYIVLHSGGGLGNFDSKIYDYYQEVVDLLKKFIPTTLKIVQIGLPNEMLLAHVDLDLRGKTNLAQINYIIKNCTLFLGNDSMPCHLAGYHRKPMVALYGGTSKPHQPYWFNPDKSIFLESHRNGLKPSFAFKESPKSINLIYPEEVVKSVCNLLSYKWPEPIETIYMGDNFKNPIIESIPDSVINPNFFNGELNLRGDLFFHETNIYQQLNLNKCVVVVSKPLDITTLIKLKQNLALLVLKIDSFPDLKNYSKQIKKANLPFTYITDIQDDEKLNVFKANLYELGHITKVPKFKKESLEFAKRVDYNTLVKSNNLVLSMGKVFASPAHWLANQPCESLQNTESKVVDSAMFWNDYSKFWFYRKA